LPASSTRPANPQQQSTLATALAAFANAARHLSEALTPSISSSITDLGGADFFDPSIAESVQAAVASNAMTPSVARDFVQNLATRRATFLGTVGQTLEGLNNLGVKGGSLPPGTADLAFLIPRDLFDNQLTSFAKELHFISRMIQNFSEALTGKAEPVVLEELSSSVPTVAVAASLTVVAALATMVNKFLDAWIKVEKIRKLRAELTDMGLKCKALEELSETINTTVTEVIEESTRTTISYYGGDPGRKNELETALGQDTRRLFGQIERGLIIQFRAEPSEEASEQDQKAIETVDRVTRVLHFPPPVDQPVLLTNGEVLEGDLEIQKVSKRVETKKTTTETQKHTKVTT
jgi:hypothetical protein